MATVNAQAAYDANLFLQNMGVSPILFAQNVVVKSTQTNNFVNSGVETNDPLMGGQLLSPGNEVILPFFNDLYAPAQQWTDKANIDVNPITAGEQRGVKLYQTQAFGFTDLSKLTQSGDPLALIQGQFSSYWKRQDTQILFALLNGVFSNAKIQQYNVYSADSNKPFNVESFERAVSLLADYQDDTFTTIAVAPAVYSQMKAQNYINLTGNDTPESRAVTPFGTYNGMNVIVDRQLKPDSNGVYTSYIFAKGAVKYDVATPENGGFEYYRHPAEQGGSNQLFSKRVYSAHVDGTTVAQNYGPLNPNGYTMADLANPNMWDVVVDPLHVHIVAYKSQVDPGFASQFYDDEAAGEAAAASAATSNSGASNASSTSSSSSH